MMTSSFIHPFKAKSWKSVLLVLLHLSIISTTLSQQPYFKNITSNKGLPSSTIYDLFSSEKGFLYLGLENGLALYNGSRFTLFPIIEYNSRSVGQIQQDHSGKIWCMNFTNQIFYLENDTLRPHQIINETIAQSGPLRDFLVHSDGIYFVTENDLYLYNSKQKINKVLSSDSTFFGNPFVALLPTNVKKGLYIFDVHQVYKFYSKTEIENTITIPKGQCVAALHNEKLIVTPKSNTSSVIIDNETINIKSSLDRFYINKIISIDKDLWYCTNSGLTKFNFEKKDFENLYFPNTRITDIIQDFEGGYWVSSVDRGLFYIPSLQTSYIHLSEYNVHKLTPGENQSFFVGTGDGMIYHYSNTGKVLKKIKTEYNSEIEFLHYIKNQNKLITSHGLIDLSNDYHYTPVRLGKNVFNDTYGNLIINTYNQVVMLNQDLKSPPNTVSSLRNNVINGFSYLNIPYLSIYNNRSITGLYDERKEDYYIGTFNGLFQISKDFKKREIQLNGKSIVASHMITNDLGEIWVATQKHGLLKLKEDKLVTFLNTSSNLSSNTCRKTIQKNNTLFILTNLGLDMYDICSGKMTEITKLMSLSDVSISDFEIINNHLHLATDAGVIILEIPKQKNPSLPRIVDLQLLTINEGKPEIPVDQFNLENKSVKFEIEAINYGNSDNFMFNYRLIGYDTVWQEQDPRNNIFNYIALPSGNYSFELRTRINDVYSPISTITFSIKKHFWESIWFYISIMILITIIVFFIFSKVLKRQRKKQDVNQRLLESQLVSLRAQMNPHFMFNIVNSVQGLIYSNKRTEASNLLGKMSMLMRRILDVSNQQNISIEKELEILKNYIELEAARFDNDFEYIIETNLRQDEQSTLIPSLVIQPFIENAFKHGLMHKKGAKKLIVKINKTDPHTITILIEDNGVGRKTSSKINSKRINHKSFAGEAIESRISLINQSHSDFHIELTIQDLESKTGEPLGTKVKLLIYKNEKN